MLGGGGGGGSSDVGGGWVTVTVDGGGGGGGGGGASVVVDGGGGVVVVNSSWNGGADVVLVDGVATFSELVLRVTRMATDATNEIAAMIATTPTTHGHRGGGASSVVSDLAS